MTADRTLIANDQSEWVSFLGYLTCGTDPTKDRRALTTGNRFGQASYVRIDAFYSQIVAKLFAFIGPKDHVRYYKQCLK